MRRDAFAETVCWPRSKRCKIPQKQKKRDTSIDLNRGAAGGAGDFGDARGNGTRNIIKALGSSAIFTE
jgi:hypothetical protein